MIKYKKVCDNCGQLFEYTSADRKTGRQLLALTLDYDINTKDTYSYCPTCGHHNLVLRKKATDDI